MNSISKVLCIAFLFIFTIGSVNAQSYKMGAGFLADFGSSSAGGSDYGPHFKYKFSPSSGVEAAVLFGDGSTLIQGAYQYHLPIASAPGLEGYFGTGAGIYLSDGDSVFTVPFMAGVEYKITGAPIALAFDWRPRLFFLPDSEYYDGYYVYEQESETKFKAGRFALGVRFTF